MVVGSVVEHTFSLIMNDIGSLYRFPSVNKALQSLKIPFLWFFSHHRVIKELLNAASPHLESLKWRHKHHRGVTVVRPAETLQACWGHEGYSSVAAKHVVEIKTFTQHAVNMVCWDICVRVHEPLNLLRAGSEQVTQCHRSLLTLHRIFLLSPVKAALSWSVICCLNVWDFRVIGVTFTAKRSLVQIITCALPELTWQASGSWGLLT